METLTFCFDHPVAVKVFFKCVTDDCVPQEIKFLRSDDSGLLTIPVTEIPAGKWHLMLEWNHEGRDFCMEKEIELPAGS